MDTAGQRKESEVGVMARREEKDDLRMEFKAVRDRAGISVLVSALLMNCKADDLEDFLRDGRETPGLTARIERFVAERNARWSKIVEDKSGAARADAWREHTDEIREFLVQTVELIPQTSEHYLQAKGYALLSLMHLGGLARLSALTQAPGNCWRCGANLQPLPAEVEVQIGAHETAAAWQAWAPETYRAKLRAVMQRGDRIVGIRAGAIVLRRPDGTLLEVSRG